jgi:hypothetical protein
MSFLSIFYRPFFHLCFPDNTFPSGAQQPHSVLRRLVVEVSWSHRIRHTHIHTHTHTHTQCRTPVSKRPVRRSGRHLHNTHLTQIKNNHTLCGIRFRDSSNQAAAVLPTYQLDFLFLFTLFLLVYFSWFSWFAVMSLLHITQLKH